MNPFGTQPASNTGAATTESDPVADLFNAQYVFGASTYAIEENPGPSTGFGGTASTTTTEDPIDLVLPASQQPTPAALGGPNTGADMKWFSWPSGQGTLVVSVPSGADVRTVWFPMVPFEISVSAGQAPGGTMYQLTETGAEAVPIPTGSQSIALTANTASPWSDLWVLASSVSWGPSKSSSGQAASSPAQALAYDQLVESNSTLLHYWPMNDPAGTTMCADYGPAPLPMQVLSPSTVGAANFIAGDDATCGYSPPGSGGFSPTLDTGNVGMEFATLEFWICPTAPGILCEWNGDSTAGFRENVLQIVNGILTFEFNFQPYTSSYALPLYGTYYFAVTCDTATTTTEVYLNGSLVFTLPNTINNGAAVLSFFFEYAAQNVQSAGKIARIAIYTGLLSPGEIQQHYATGSTSG